MNLLAGGLTTRPTSMRTGVHIAPDAMTVDDGHHSLWEYSRIEVR